MNAESLLANSLFGGGSVKELLTHFVAELGKEKISGYELSLGGSSVLSLVSQGVKPRDIDLKMVFTSISGDRAKIEVFEKIRAVWSKVIEKPMHLSPAFARLGHEAYANHCFLGGEGALPLDFSLRVYSDDEVVDHVTNVDSLYLSVEELLKGEVILRSKEGEVSDVLSQIQRKVLRSQVASRVQGGWGRVLLYLTTGWTIEDPLLLKMASLDDLANLTRLTKKIPSSMGRFLFWANALLHAPSDRIREEVRRFYPKNWPPLPKEGVEGFLTAALCLLAGEVRPIDHLGRPCLQCCFTEGSVLVLERCWEKVDITPLLPLVEWSKDKFLYLPLQLEEQVRDGTWPLMLFFVEDENLRKAIVGEKDEARAKALCFLCPTLPHEALLSLLEEEEGIEKLTKEEKERIDVREIALILCNQPISVYERGCPLRPLLAGQKPKVICDVLQVMVEQYGDTLKEVSPAFWEDIHSLVTLDFPLKPRQRLLDLLARPLYGIREGKAYDLLHTLIHSLGGQVGEGIEERILDAVVRQDERALASLLKDEIDEKLLEGVERTLFDKALLVLSENGYAKKALEYKPSLLLCVKLYQKSKKKEGVLGYVKEKIAELSSSELLILYVGMKQGPELLFLIEERLAQQESLGKLTEGQKKLLLERMPVLIKEGNVELAIQLLGLLPFSEELEKCLLLLLEKQEIAPLLASKLEPLLSFFFLSRIKGRDRIGGHKVFLSVLDYLPHLRREGWLEYKKDKTAMEREKEVTRFYLGSLSFQERFLFSFECFSHQDLFNQALLENPVPFMESYEGWTEESLLGWFQSFVRTGRDRQEVDRILLRKLPSYFSKDVEPFFTQLRGDVEVDLLKDRFKEQIGRVKDKDPVHGMIRFMGLHFYRLTGELPEEFWQMGRRYLSSSARVRPMPELRKGVQDYLDRGGKVEDPRMLSQLVGSSSLNFEQLLMTLLSQIDPSVPKEILEEVYAKIDAVCQVNPAHRIDVLSYVEKKPNLLAMHARFLPIKEYVQSLFFAPTLPSILVNPLPLALQLISVEDQDLRLELSESLLKHIALQKKKGNLSEATYNAFLSHLVLEIHWPFLCSTDGETVDLGMVTRHLAFYDEYLHLVPWTPFILPIRLIDAFVNRCRKDPNAYELLSILLRYVLFFCRGKSLNSYMSALIHEGVFILTEPSLAALRKKISIGEKDVLGFLECFFLYPWTALDALYAIDVISHYVSNHPSVLEEYRQKKGEVYAMEMRILSKAYDYWKEVELLPERGPGETLGSSQFFIARQSLSCLIHVLQKRRAQIKDAPSFNIRPLIDLFVREDLPFLQKCVEDLWEDRGFDKEFAALVRERVSVLASEGEEKVRFLRFLGRLLR